MSPGAVDALGGVGGPEARGRGGGPKAVAVESRDWRSGSRRRERRRAPDEVAREDAGCPRRRTRRQRGRVGSAERPHRRARAPARRCRRSFQEPEGAIVVGAFVGDALGSTEAPAGPTGVAQARQGARSGRGDGCRVAPVAAREGGRADPRQGAHPAPRPRSRGPRPRSDVQRLLPRTLKVDGEGQDRPRRARGTRRGGEEHRGHRGALRRHPRGGAKGADPAAAAA